MEREYVIEREASGDKRIRSRRKETMKDYSVSISLSCEITAKNEEQAEERAQAIADSLEAVLKGKRPVWWPDEIVQDEVTVDEE